MKYQDAVKQIAAVYAHQLIVGFMDGNDPDGDEAEALGRESQGAVRALVVFYPEKGFMEVRTDLMFEITKQYQAMGAKINEMGELSQ